MKNDFMHYSKIIPPTVNLEAMMSNRKYKFSAIFDEAIVVNSESSLATSPLLEELEKSTDRYTDLEFYKCGGSKIIYQAKDQRTGRLVALARLPDEAGMSDIDAFLREARINAQLQHPNIVPIYDIGLIKQAPYFCMKFIDGESLEEILQKQKAEPSSFSSTTFLDIFLKLCDAIAYAHTQGVLHLDLKPDNIQINNFGDVLVCDWGLARILDEHENINDDFGSLDNYSLSKVDLNHKTLNGFIKGTPGYMAPEQTGRYKAHKGITTDTYGLGCLLYSLLCYEKPFSGNLEQILEKTARGTFPPPSQIKPKLPARLETICLKAMSLDPSDRYQTVQELHEDILAYRNGYATSAEDASFIKLLGLFIQRNKILASVVFFSSLTMVILTLGFIRGLEESRQQALLAQSIAEKAEAEAIDLNLQYLHEKKVNDQRGKVLSTQFFNKYVKAYSVYNIPDSLDYLNSAVKLDPTNKLAWLNKARCHCINYEFDKSLQAYEKAKSTDSLYDIALKYVNDPRIIDAQFKVEVIVETMKKHGPNRPSSDFVHHQVYSNLPLDERLIFVREVLKLFNPPQKLLNFSFEEVSQHLDISGNKQLNWAYALQNFPAKSINMSHTNVHSFQNIMTIPVQELNVSFTAMQNFNDLTVENLRSLNISHTNIKDLKPLSASPLQILDISFCPITSLLPIKNMKFLRNLTIHKNQFSAVQLALIPAHVGITIVK
ncbi:protein kinase [Lentisphaera profundi]|uniref:Protein kinase n=1 Tax=Lentisphaera profundi TaxID=1658616 RepID=A0ABY7W1N4_9BACT|nr:protein kinase [Lentisphaera profundi]WDE98889.1 protein kinase [Lentisphaera profundi]